jgi:hypothetical protein
MNKLKMASELSIVLLWEEADQKAKIFCVKQQMTSTQVGPLYSDFDCPRKRFFTALVRTALVFGLYLHWGCKNPHTWSVKSLVQ